MEVIGDELPQWLEAALAELGVVSVTRVKSEGVELRKRNLKLAKAPAESRPVADWKDL